MSTVLHQPEFPARLRLGLLAAAVLGLAAAAVGWAVDPQAFFAAWLTAFLIWTGLALGCLGLLMIGHLLAESWLGPLRTELEAGARSLPLAILAAAPLAFGLDALYPWAGAQPVTPDPLPEAGIGYLAPGPVILRSALYLAIWAGLAVVIARRGRHRLVSGLGLLVLLVTVTLATIDWITSLDPRWLSSMFPVAWSLTQLAGALAGAMLVALLRAHPEPPERLETMTRTLLWLILAVVHLWFAQFLIVWSANLPNEVIWYLLRGGGWAWLKLGLVVPATIIAIALLLPRRIRRGRTALAAGLLLAQHLALAVWLVRPDIAAPAFTWLDPAVLIGLGGAWLAVTLTVLPARSVAQLHAEA